MTDHSMTHEDAEKARLMKEYIRIRDLIRIVVMSSSDGYAESKRGDADLLKKIETNEIKDYGATASTVAFGPALEISLDPHHVFTNLSAERFNNGDGPSTEISTSVTLMSCREKIFKPYFRILSLLGLRPLWNPITHRSDGSYLRHMVNKFYLLFIISMVMLGHVLEYASCSRRDGFSPYREKHLNQLVGTNNSMIVIKPTGFIAKIIEIICQTHDHNEMLERTHPLPSVGITDVVCSGGIASTYIFPTMLHLAAFFCMLYQMNCGDFERLENFVEKVFLQAKYNQAWKLSQRNLVKHFRWFMGLGMTWMVLSICSLAFQIMEFKNSPTGVNYTWMHPRISRVVLIYDICLMLCLLLNDVICVVIATSYCFNCQLMLTFLSNLTEAIHLKSITFLDCYKEVQNASSFLDYMNDKQAAGISLLLLHFCIKITTGVYGLVSGESQITDSWLILISTVLMISYWCILVIFPIYMAVRVTESCSRLRKMGHQIRAKPFAYEHVPSGYLDSFLVYLTTLKLHAKIFRIPVRSSCVLLAFLSTVFALITLGQLGLTYFSSL